MQGGECEIDWGDIIGRRHVGQRHHTWPPLLLVLLPSYIYTFLSFCSQLSFGGKSLRSPYVIMFRLLCLSMETR